MDTKQLARIDLNLLVALQVLLEERNVSRAAERLFVTQSAMSKTLGRLRELFGDPLFTRSSHGMVPTPKAEEIKVSLQAILSGVQELTTEQEFDPKNYVGDISIAVSEHIGVLLLPALMEILQIEAPKLRVTTLSRVERQLDELTEGSLDFAIHIKRNHYRPEFQLHTLGHSQPVLLVRQGHPLRKEAYLGWQQMSLYPRVALYMPNVDEMQLMGQAGDLFGQLENQIREVFETSHLYTALEVVRRTDCMMVGPPFLSSFSKLGGGIVSLALPDSVKASIEYVLVTHQRSDNSAIHNWLREKILKLSELFEAEQEEDDNPYSAFGKRPTRR